MKLAEIVKPSNLSDFIRLQFSCLDESTEKMQFLARLDHPQIDQQHYLPNKTVLELIAVYELTATSMSLLVSDRCAQTLVLFERSLTGKQIADALGVAWVELHKGLALQAVEIPKPWGKEIWYTGIEQRGVSKVKSEEGTSPLDWVLAAAPEHIMGLHKVPTLLKILDPLPDEVYGDLYFEMHEEKQEVYVVTHVDKQAWPDGKGGIRFGFNQQLRKTFACDQDFKQAYLQAVKNYQQVRKQIDDLQDKKGSPSADLIKQEKGLRHKMEDFIAIKTLQLGDVVKVPCFVPHSLQHGVRTVEFQTPVYERKILSFAQKVLTQDHWDTEAALELLVLDAPQDAPLTLIEETSELRREQVVQFSDFKVERISLSKNATFSFEKKCYLLMLVVSGEVEFENISMLSGDARLLPAGCAFNLRCLSENAVVLLAEPQG